MSERQDVLTSPYTKPPGARRHYAGEPLFEWLAIEYHLSQPCAIAAMCDSPLPHGCRNVFTNPCPRLPTGRCECWCHA